MNKPTSYDGNDNITNYKLKIRLYFGTFYRQFLYNYTT